MPRYFFHSQDGRAYVDRNGAEFTGVNAARREAACYLAELLREGPDELWATGRLEITVTDTAGGMVCVLTLTAAVSPGRV